MSHDNVVLKIAGYPRIRESNDADTRDDAARGRYRRTGAASGTERLYLLPPRGKFVTRERKSAVKVGRLPSELYVNFAIAVGSDRLA